MVANSIILVLLLFGALIIMGSSTYAPFIYTLFDLLLIGKLRAIIGKIFNKIKRMKSLRYYARKPKRATRRSAS